MSESTSTLKKAIPIIAVTWILSLTTTLVFVYFVIPNIFPPTWHEVTTFSGTFQEFNYSGTESFYVPSDHWRFEWSVECDAPPPTDVEFRLFLGFLGDSLVWLTREDFIGSVGQDIESWNYLRGSEYITGSGAYTFWLVGANLDWKITVEAYY
jgi:hypothetical protein